MARYVSVDNIPSFRLKISDQLFTCTGCHRPRCLHASTNITRKAVWHAQKWCYVANSSSWSDFSSLVACAWSAPCPGNGYLSSSMFKKLCTVDRFTSEAAIFGKWENIHHWAFTSRMWARAGRAQPGNTQVISLTWDSFQLDGFMARVQMIPLRCVFVWNVFILFGLLNLL